MGIEWQSVGWALGKVASDEATRRWKRSPSHRGGRPMPWLATGASVCGTLNPPVRTEISLRPAGPDELDRDLVDGVPDRSSAARGHWRRHTGAAPSRDDFALPQ